MGFPKAYIHVGKLDVTLDADMAVQAIDTWTWWDRSNVMFRGGNKSYILLTFRDPYQLLDFATRLQEHALEAIKWWLRFEFSYPVYNDTKRIGEFIEWSRVPYKLGDSHG